MSTWDVELHSEVASWFLGLVKSDPETADLVEEAIDLLEKVGPTLGRPMVDRIKGSRHHNMKELRPASRGGSEIRILFAFDPRRCALLVLAGDKAGDWQTWYARSVPIADRRYEAHLDALAMEENE